MGRERVGRSGGGERQGRRRKGGAGIKDYTDGIMD